MERMIQIARDPQLFTTLVVMVALAIAFASAMRVVLKTIDARAELARLKLERAKLQVACERVKCERAEIEYHNSKKL